MMNFFARKTLATAALCLCAPAMAEIVVVVNQKNPATRMMSEQAAQFFLGKSAMFTPIDQNDDTAIKSEFYQKISGKDTSQVKAIWVKLVFTGKSTLPKSVANSTEVKKAVAADPMAIGYIEKSALDGSVKAILTIP
jgi:ABC-type phosphate transport system substrate-binding protein